MTAASWKLPALLAVTVGLASAAAPLAGAKCADQTPTSALLKLTQPGELGERLVFVGRVMDAEDRPVPGAKLYVYHADAYGAYSKLGEDEPRLCGVLRTDARGSFRIETVLPSGRKSIEPGPPHIHGTVSAPGRDWVGFVVNLEPQKEQFEDAAYRAGWGVRSQTTRKVYQDKSRTWWLIWNPRI